METSCESNYFLDPNFALRLFGKCGHIKGTVHKIKFIIEEFQKNKDVFKPKKQTVKNNVKSKELREEGDIYFAMNNQTAMLFKAIELYNESICYAENDLGEELAIGYAKRSAVCFRLEQYKICLDNITLSKANGCPERFLQELNKREEDCFEELKKLFVNREYEFDIKLSLKPHQHMPFAADCLQMKADKVCGRYIVTTQDLNPGEIIVVENPFVKVLSDDWTYQRCSNCLRASSSNLLPCPNCTKTMFCSDKCMEDAFGNFHKFECPIIECLRNVGGQITIRTFIKAFQSFSSIRELIEFCQSKDLHNLTSFSFDHSKEVSTQQQYQQIHGLATNQAIRSQLDLFTHAMITALFYYQLVNYTTFKDFINDENEDYLIELMFRMELITTINSFNFDDLSSQLDCAIIGTGLYPFSSLINHSCCPNVCPKFYDTKLILHTKRKVKRGESISISYK